MTVNRPGLSADDRLEIQQLMAEYAFCDDTGDAERWASLFTAEGTFVGLGKAPVVGRAALEAFARKRWDDKPEVRRRTHFVSNIVIHPSPEGATAESYQMTIDKFPDGQRVKGVTGKSDELRVENGKWRFHSRRTVSRFAE